MPNNQDIISYEKINFYLTTQIQGIRKCYEEKIHGIYEIKPRYICTHMIIESDKVEEIELHINNRNLGNINLKQMSI